MSTNLEISFTPPPGFHFEDLSSRTQELIGIFFGTHLGHLVEEYPHSHEHAIRESKLHTAINNDYQFKLATPRTVMRLGRGATVNMHVPGERPREFTVGPAQYCEGFFMEISAQTRIEEGANGRKRYDLRSHDLSLRLDRPQLWEGGTSVKTGTAGWISLIRGDFEIVAVLPDQSNEPPLG